MTYTPRPVIIDCTNAGLALAEKSYANGLLIRDEQSKDVLAAAHADPLNHGLFDHADLIRRALAGDIGRLEEQLATARDLLADAGSLLDDAISNHIYDDDDEIPDDCAYSQTARHIRAFLSGEAWPEPAAVPGPQVVIIINGGMVEDVYGYGLPENAAVLVADQDGNCDSRVVLMRPPKAPHKIAPAALTLGCDVDRDLIVPLSAPAEIVE